MLLAVIMVGSTNLEDLASGLPGHVYPIFDIYGKCEKISLLTGNDATRNGNANGTPILEAPEALELDNMPQQCEKAHLEMHEKEKDTEQLSDSARDMPTGASTSAAGNIMWVDK